MATWQGYSKGPSMLMILQNFFFFFLITSVFVFYIREVLHSPNLFFKS
jgi:hypothetical protein